MTSRNSITKEKIIARLNEIIHEMSRDRLLALLRQLDEKPSPWKREHPRKNCSITIEYDTTDYSSTKNIRNLSVGGVYIIAGESFHIGQNLTLWLSAPGEKPLSVKVPGKVVRRDPEGIGVRFENLNAHQLKMIKIFEKMDGV